MSILNFSFYRFVAIPTASLPALRDELKRRALAGGLRGSILLSEEGINGFIAAEEKPLRDYYSWLKTQVDLGDVLPKESRSEHVPFKRMLVKIKKEIITMGRPEIHPRLKTGQRLEPKVLKQWLDSKKPVVLLDTRNDYEIEQGKFAGAIDYHIKTFRQFPDRLAQDAAKLKDQTVVMYCTGGIRCEKATALALELGLKDVYQLEGGILKYMEEVGGAHYDGDCFVFDGRQAVDANLTGAIDRDTKRRIGTIAVHSYRRCPFAMRVRWTLEEKGLPYTVIEENLREPSEALLKLNPKGEVPVLKHQGTAIRESIIINEYLDEAFPEHPLMPTEPERRAKTRLWGRWCDEAFKPLVDKYKYTHQRTEGELDQIIGELHRCLAKLEQPLARRTFLMGDALTLADIHVAPFVRQLSRCEPAMPGWDRFPKTRDWLNRLLSRPAFERVIAKA